MELNDTAGILISPPVGSGQSQCFWRLRTPVTNDSGILLTFDQFFLEDTPDCSRDHLIIYDGPNDKAPLIGQYCGLLTGETVISNGTVLYLTYNSSPTQPLAGFQIQYKTVHLGK